ncbi:hypothetical protein BDR03DRAFT_955995 [Suillus americanus]|nr:hypothetical protein BDR03DRAFT_955995 [Suillus americanus]
MDWWQYLYVVVGAPWQCLATGLIWNKGMLRTGTKIESAGQMSSVQPEWHAHA